VRKRKNWETEDWTFVARLTILYTIQTQKQKT
jgi:hypothetical protein